MKKLLFLFTLSSVFLLGCSNNLTNDDKDKKIAELEQKLKDDTFQKNQECSKNYTQIQSRINDIKSKIGSKIVGNINIEAIFYSPSYKSCMFGYFYREQICGTINGNCGPQDIMKYVNEFKIEDYFTKQIVYDPPNGDTFEQFQSKIKGLKGESENTTGTSLNK